MPQQIINYIAKNFNTVFGSPYSSSFYSEEGQTWDFSPKNQIRVANHWNFWSRDYSNPYSNLEQHAITDIEVENNTHWTIAQKDTSGFYRVILSLPVTQEVSKNNSQNKYDLLAQKMPNEILYQFKVKTDRLKAIEVAKKIEKSKLATVKKSSLEKKIERLVTDKKLKKGTNTFDFITQLLNGSKILRPVYYIGSGRNTKTVDESIAIVKLLQLLNIKYSTTNDAPRGGKTGYRIDIQTKVN